MTSPSPEIVLDALRDHMVPQPMAPQLPSTLRLYAHLTLVSNAIHEQASSALTVNAASRRPSQLSPGDIDIVEGCQRRALARGREMRRLSLDLRRAHLQIVMANPKAPPKQVDMMLDSYFPTMDEACSAIEGHSMLFITYLNGDEHAEEIAEIKRHRAEIEGWLKGARGSVSAGKPWPAAPKGQRLGTLTAMMFPLAEEVVEDAERLMGVFEFEPNRRRSLPEQTVERPTKVPRKSTIL